MILISNFLKNLYLTPRSMRGQAFIFIVLQELRSYMQFHLLVTIFHYMSQCLNPNTDFFLVRIFMHSDWIQSISPHSVRMRENTDQKKLHIWTLFKQCVFNQFIIFSLFISFIFTTSLSLFNLFSTNVARMDKPGSWFLLAKCLKSTCGRVTL